MKKIFFIAVILLASASRSPAEDNTAAQQLLDSAIEQETLFADAAGPCELELDFTAQIKGPAQGHLSLDWESKDHWRGQVTLSGYEQTEIRNGEWEYTFRNLEFTPLPVHDLFDLLQLGAIPYTVTANKQKTRNEGVEETTCIQGQPKGFGNETREVCVDSSSHQLLSDEWQAPQDRRRREQFSDYFDFQGRQYPRKIELLVNKKSFISANVNTIKPTSLNPALLVPPKGAIERRHCPGMIPAKAIKMEPLMPEHPGDLHGAGDTTVSMTILTDGSVADIRLLGHGGPTADALVLAAAKKWKFQPAMCGNEPVLADQEVIISYRTNF